jgi:hypothetical protein
MSRYDGTFSCGHEGSVNVTGPTKNRQWIADRKFEGLCPECYKAHLQVEKEKANLEAAEKAEEMELPELVGSEKQVAWANTLRLTHIEIFDKHINSDRYDEDVKLVFAETLDWYLKEHIKATWWIENRYESVNVITLAREYKKSTEIQEIETSLATVKAESTVQPENKKYDGTVEIECKENIIQVRYEKNDDFIKLVKKLGYKWEGVWKREIDDFSGPISDRIAELGNTLLNKGFSIMIIDNEIRQRAIEGSFEPECKRWIGQKTKGEYKDWLFINWSDNDNEMYKKARIIKGSKWSNPSVVAPVKSYRELEDFAEINNFKFTEKARATIEEYKKKEKSIPKVVPKKTEIVETKDELKEILNSDTNILEDLKED